MLGKTPGGVPVHRVEARVRAEPLLGSSRHVVLTRWFVLRRGMMEVREGEEEGRSNLQIIGQPTIIARDGRELASRVRGANPYRPSEERSRAGFARIRESEERVVCQSVCLSESIITA